MASKPLKHTRSGSMVQNVAGRPEPDSGPGPDLPAVWISPQTHQKYTVVYSELIRSLLATSYASLTIIGTSDVRDQYLIRGRICPPNGYLLKYNKKIHGHALRANPVTISHFLCVPHYYWGVGRPGSVSDPGPDLSTKWISPQIHKKYTVMYSKLIRSLLATSYASLTIIGASTAGVGIGDNTHHRALLTVRMAMLPLRRVSDYPSTITQSMSDWLMIG